MDNILEEDHTEGPEGGSSRPGCTVVGWGRHRAAFDLEEAVTYNLSYCRMPEEGIAEEDICRPWLVKEGL